MLMTTDNRLVLEIKELQYKRYNKNMWKFCVLQTGLPFTYIFIFNTGKKYSLNI